MDWLAEDIVLYFTFADNFFRGQIPYRDYFFNWFPGSFLVFLFPRVGTANPFYYAAIFMAGMATLFFAQLHFLVKRWGKTKKEKTWLVFLILSAALILPLALIRFDLVPTVLTLVALTLFLKKASLWTETFLALGTATKIFPGALLPLFLIHFWQKREKRRAFGGLFVYLLSIVIILTPFILLGGGKGLLWVLDYHLGRSIQIESLPASILFLGFFFGSEASTFNAFGSWNVSVLDWNEAVSQMFFILWPTSIALTYFWFWKQTKRRNYAQEQEFLLVKASLITILVFIGFNKVFSPQYLIWPFPFVFWFLLYLPRKRMIILGTLWWLIIFLTMLNLFNYWDLISLKQSVILSQILRNVLVLIFLGGVLVTHADEKNRLARNF